MVAAVIQRDGKLLVCQRPAHKRHGMLWEFPGGKLEQNESLLQAAQRELFEELSLHVTAAGALLFTIKDEASGFDINFLEVDTDGSPHLHEHVAMQWCSPADLLKLNLAPSDKSFAEFLTQAKP